MPSRILWVARWSIPVAVVIGATQLPATAQTNDPIRTMCVATDSHPIVQANAPHRVDNSLPCHEGATDGSGKVMSGRPAIDVNLDRTHIGAPVYEVAAERAQTPWSTLSRVRTVTH